MKGETGATNRSFAAMCQIVLAQLVIGIMELFIAMEIDYFQLNRAEYFVPIVVKTSFPIHRNHIGTDGCRPQVFLRHDGRGQRFLARSFTLGNT